MADDTETTTSKGAPDRRHQQTATGTPAHLTPEEEHERKQRVLTHGTPSITQSIADAVVIKDSNPFFLTQPDGCIPLTMGHGYGLYYDDCRFLNGYELKIAGTAPTLLASTAVRGFTSVFQLTNADIHTTDGRLVKKEELGIEWRRAIDGEQTALYDLLGFQNFGLDDAQIEISLTFRSAFEDIFEVRGLLAEPLGKVCRAQWRGDTLVLAYDGKDDLYRSVRISFSEAPDRVEGLTAHFVVDIPARGSTELRIGLVLAESKEARPIEQPLPAPDAKAIHAVLDRSDARWLGGQTSIETDSLLLNGILDRSQRDLHMLRSHIGDEHYFAAGVPWFATLFGRDSIITAMQYLAYEPDIAAHTLRLLARYQGTKVDDFRDEQPGKILHSLRIGEMARLGEIPHTPYYGTIDSTPLFLILFGLHAAWSGSLDLFHELRSHIEAALEWMNRWGSPAKDGYLAYESMSEHGLINQGWKDSGDAIVNADGSLARPPIALVEVQGYAYSARRLIAGLYRRSGDADRAAKLEQEASALRERFNRDFWLDKKGYYALALEKGECPVEVLSSNPGQALWTGIVPADRAAKTVHSLLGDDMFSGWGIRTLSTRERRYNPVGYHLGTVWPHDNSIIAAGFRRYGFDREAMRIFTGIIEAAMHFREYRLPELFAGFPRQDYGVPVHFPVACHPQAWAAGSVPFLFSTLLGLAPEAFEHRLCIVRPMLPDFVHVAEVRNLHVGDASCDLRFSRTPEGMIAVEVLKTHGELNVLVEPQSADRI